MPHCLRRGIGGVGACHIPYIILYCPILSYKTRKLNSLREFVYSRHPDPRRMWKGGSEQHLLTPLPGAPGANSKKLYLAMFYNDFGTFARKDDVHLSENPIYAQGDPKASRRDPKGRPKGAKGTPKGDKGISKGPQSVEGGV